MCTDVYVQVLYIMLYIHVHVSPVYVHLHVHVPFHCSISMFGHCYLIYSSLHLYIFPSVGSYYCYDNPAALTKTFIEVRFSLHVLYMYMSVPTHNKHWYNCT